MNNNIISIISDWQKNDYYLGIIKAKIIASNPNVTIVDISHNVPHYSTIFAGFLLKNTYKNFPKETIHVIAIKSCESKNEKAILMKFNEQYFICNNNGILSFLISNKVDNYEAFEIIHNYPNSTFPEKDIFTETAIKLLSNIPISKLGKKIEKIKTFENSEAIVDRNQIVGNIIYFDSFGNAITNITKEVFYKNVKKSFSIMLDHSDIKICEISKNYTEKNKGELIAIFNSLNLLEICQHSDNVEQKFSLNSNSSILIEFSTEYTLF